MLREWRRCSRYTSLVGLGGFSLKTIGGWFSTLGSKLGVDYLGLKTISG